MSLIDQYIKIQNEYIAKFGTKTIVLCQTGSFYEVYAFKIDDWQIKVANELLDLKIASKKSNNTSIYMAGFPDHATARFEKKLLKNNYSVVYMNQSVNSSGKIERKVTNVISNGSNFDSNESLIASVFFEKEDEEEYYVHEAIFDTNLGETTVIVNNSIIKDTNSFINMFVSQYKVSELITNVSYKNDKILVHQKTFNKKKNNEIVDLLEEYFINLKHLYIHIKDRIGFNVLLDQSIENAINLLEFVKFHNESLVKNLKMPIIQKQSEFLEKFNGFDKVIDIDSVIKLIDFCKTTEGSKRLSNIIQNPIYDIDKLNKRYENIQTILNNQDIFKITDKLNKISNIERLNRKIEIGKLEKYDITKLLKSNKICYEVLRDLKEFDCSWIPSSKTLEEFKKYINKIEAYFDIDKIDTLNIFKNEKEIDKICNEIDMINKRIETLSKTFDIDVKIQYNEKSGFFFETSRKKGLELKEKFKDFNYQQLTSICKISNKEMDNHSQNFEKLNKELEIKTNEKIIAFFDENYYKYYESSKKVAFKTTWTDVFQSIAIASLKLNLKRPILKEGDTSSIECKDLRHILVENAFKNTKNAFVPNDVNLKDNNYLIYGVNSVGKSVYLKSIGIAVILAQSGIFVPANECVLTPYKKAFTRFGNSDNLSRNHSSFISEIYEIENIVNNCDSNSLVIADECCSSTEIKSAIEIITSTIKWLTEKKSTFVFSSHFFELIDKVKSVESLSIAYLKITETKDDIIFDRKLTIGTPKNVNYGTKIAKTIFTNKNFKKLLEQTDGFKDKKVIKSRYNSSLVVKRCIICQYAPKKDTDLPLDVHHIGMQSDADQNGFLNNIHKNDIANLVVLCKACHQNTHKGIITISGWKTSLNGSKLDYVINT